MPQKRTLLYLGLAVGGYLAYRWYEKNKAAMAPVGPQAPLIPSTLSNPTHIPSSGTIAPMTVAPTDRIIAWVGTMSQVRQDMWNNQILPSLTAPGISILDGVVNAFNMGVALSPSQNDFWNSLIAKFGQGI